MLSLSKFAFDGDYDFTLKVVILHCLLESFIFCHASLSRFPTFDLEILLSKIELQMPKNASQYSLIFLCSGKAIYQPD